MTTVSPAPAPAGPRRPRRRLLARHPLARFVVRRLAVGVVLVLAVSFLVFLATNLLPGDAARAMLGPRARPAQLAAFRHELGLDRPLLSRYGDYLNELAHGRLGYSLTGGSSALSGDTAEISRRPVSGIIAEPVRNTLVLGLVTVALLLPLSLVLGVLSGIRPDGVLAQVVSVLTLAGLSVPEFVVGTLLILAFAVSLHWFPPVSLLAPGQNPFEHPEILVLPVLTLLVVSVGFTTRQIRAGVMRAMDSEYVEMARLSGIAERRVVLRWGLRNALAPSIQTFAQIVQWLLGGVVLVEVVFSYPGIGAGFVQYVASRDLPTVQSVAILVAAIYIGMNILADLLVVLVVPRLRTEQ
jgi:peptide/nickel transport system permease protein